MLACHEVWPESLLLHGVVPLVDGSFPVGADEEQARRTCAKLAWVPSITSSSRLNARKTVAGAAVAIRRMSLARPTICMCIPFSPDPAPRYANIINHQNIESLPFFQRAYSEAVWAPAPDSPVQRALVLGEIQPVHGRKVIGQGEKQRRAGAPLLIQHLSEKPQLDELQPARQQVRRDDPRVQAVDGAAAAREAP